MMSKLHRWPSDLISHTKTPQNVFPSVNIPGLIVLRCGVLDTSPLAKGPHGKFALQK